jgi:3-deoxy-D-manno-octulosonic-acid transferase
MYYVIYNLLLAVGMIFLVPYYGAKILFAGKYRKSIGPKLGFLDATILSGSLKGRPRIWVHAVSVGEVTAAAPIMEKLRKNLPDACLILSTSTETGQEMARKIVPHASAFIYFPLDFPFVVRKVVGIIRPEIFVAMETEIWPNFIRICRESGARLLILNGRISPRSYKRYMKTKDFWKTVLLGIDEIGVISRTDADRIKDIGIEEKKVHVVGNAKYDSLASRAEDPTLQAEVYDKLDITPGSMVFVAGSTHYNEESVVLDVYRGLLDKFPGLLLILVPRHIERRDEVLSLVNKSGFSDCITMSEIKSGRRRSGQRVILVDVIGELFKIYSMASLVFCGGSLVPRGGQNILEAGAWGKVVLFGPFMDDFPAEKNLLETAGAGITVEDGNGLLETATRFLSDPELLQARGKAGKEAIFASRGASDRYVQMIMDKLDTAAQRRR